MKFLCKLACLSLDTIACLLAWLSVYIDKYVGRSCPHTSHSASGCGGHKNECPPDFYYGRVITDVEIYHSQFLTPINFNDRPGRIKTGNT